MGWRAMSLNSDLIVLLFWKQLKKCVFYYFIALGIKNDQAIYRDISFANTCIDLKWGQDDI